MGSGMSSLRRSAASEIMGSGVSILRQRLRRFVSEYNLVKGMMPLLGLQVVFEYGRPGSDRPPVTAALLATNVLIFFRPGPLHRILPRTCDIAFNYQLFVKFMLFENFFLSPFYHGSEAHLFCNMTSLLWTGVMLERSMGSVQFASMVATLLGLSQGIAVLLSQCFSLLGDSTAYYDHHCIGFSGVLYGMITVLTGQSNYIVWLQGIDTLAKYAVWADMFITQALCANVSFLGHLGGILAGQVYLWLKHLFKGRDPLTLLISVCAGIVTSQVRFALKLLRSVLRQGYITGRGMVVYHSSARECPQGLWRCSTCTNYNSLATDICEMCSTMRKDCAFLLGQHHQAWCNGELSVEEIHCRRLDRLDR
ncbi:unnamed protein product [Urochloa decumbens]|uniref:RanBP2-type domain-containing protein n=1 Tax=Urochloa decumbens TaxID=240449 RepID=A0ABC8ZNY5_9POAL